MFILTGTSTADPCLSPDSIMPFYLDMTFLCLIENTKKPLIYQKNSMATAFLLNLSFKFTAPVLQCHRPSHSAASQCRVAAECSLVPSKCRTPSDLAYWLVLLQPWWVKVLRTLPYRWHEGRHLSYPAWSLARHRQERHG